MQKFASLRLRSAALATTASLAFVAQDAHAQEQPVASAVNQAEDDDPIDKDNIITVTATRVESDLLKTPIAVTAISAAELESKSFEDISDIDKSAPNLTFLTGANSSGTGNSASVFIRGIGQSDFVPTADPGVGIYVDGVYLGRSVGGILKLTDIAQVEVLRGPQGTLFGRNTIGGAINITTAPTSTEFGGKLGFTVGSDDLLQFNGSVEGPIANDLTGRLSVQATKRDGYSTSLNSDFDFGNEDNAVVRARLDWEPSVDWGFSLTADYYTQDEDSTPSVSLSQPPGFNGISGSLFNQFVGTSLATGVPFGSPPVTPADFILESDFVDIDEPFITAKTGPSRDDAEVWGAALTAEYSGIDAFRIKSITAYREVNADFADDNDALLQNSASTMNSFSQEQFSQELQFIGESSKFDWIAGIYYFHERGVDTNFVDLNPGAFTFLEGLPGPIFALGPVDCAVVPMACAGGLGNPANLLLDFSLNTFTDLTVDNIAAYFNGTYKVTPSFSINLGARVTYEKKNIDTFQLRRDATAALGMDVFAVAPTDVNADWTNFAPKLGLSYDGGEAGFVYANFSRGFRSGTFNSRGSAQGIAQEVAPEIVNSYEIGYKNEFANNRIRLTAAAYYNDYQDIQVQATVPNPESLFEVILVNAAKAEIYGFEAEMVAQAAEGLELSANVGYANSSIQEVDPAISIPSGIEEGDDLQRTPEWSAGLSAQYTHSTAWGDIYGRIGFTWQDDIFHTANNDAREGAYGLLDLRLGLQLENGLEVAVYGINVTDQTYYNSIFVTGGASSVGYPARPAQWGVTLSKNF